MSTGKRSRLKIIIGNISYTFMTNFITLFISTLTVLFAPKILGIEDFGMWQMYLLYASYTGFIQLGLCDGFYLRYGGDNYDDLDKRMISSQFYFVSALYLVVSPVIYILLLIFAGNEIYSEIMILALVSGLITTSRGLLFYLLQATGKISSYARISVIDRLLFAALAVLLFIVKKEYTTLIFSDLIGKCVSLLLVSYECRDIFKSKIQSMNYILKESKHNIQVGMNIMLANISSMLIIGIVRLSIENNWGIAAFSEVSLSMSISNLLLTFINSIGIVIFPILRRISREKISLLYNNLKTILMVPLLFFLLLYYPLKIIVSFWLPHYEDSLSYMAILFPICIYESKMAMLVNVYLKTLRKEKTILLLNGFTVLVSIITTFITVFILESFIFSIASITFLLAIRCIVSEITLSKYISINLARDIWLELMLSLVFVFGNWFLPGWYGTLVYLLVYLLYIILKKNDIKTAFYGIKRLNSESF